jgi:hypothetical protein
MFRGQRYSRDITRDRNGLGRLIMWGMGQPQKETSQNISVESGRCRLFGNITQVKYESEAKGNDKFGAQIGL